MAKKNTEREIFEITHETRSDEWGVCGQQKLKLLVEAQFRTRRENSEREKDYNFQVSRLLIAQYHFPVSFLLLLRWIFALFCEEWLTCLLLGLENRFRFNGLARLIQKLFQDYYGASCNIGIFFYCFSLFLFFLIRGILRIYFFQKLFFIHTNSTPHNFFLLFSFILISDQISDFVVWTFG